MHLIEHDLVRMTNAIESCHKSKDGNNDNGELVIPFRPHCRLDLLARLVQNTNGTTGIAVGVWCGWTLFGAPVADRW